MAQGVNAVENELYLTTAAKLANRLPSTPSAYYYLNEAVKAYATLGEICDASANSFSGDRAEIS